MASACNILIISDVPGWAYARRAKALQKYAPSRLLVAVRSMGEVTPGNIKRADLIFLLDYANIDKVCDWRGFGTTPLVVAFNADHRRRREMFDHVCQQADFVVCNNRHRFLDRGRHENCCYIPNGVDPEQFQVSRPIEERFDRVLWCSSVRSLKQKGYHDVLVPLYKLLKEDEFEPILRITGPAAAWDAATMCDWYNSGSYILCTSPSEGTANPIIEGVSCGCVAVTTDVGNVSDWGVSGQNCMVCEPDPQRFHEALRYARKFRVEMAREGLKAAAGWSYRDRTKTFFGLFERIIKYGAGDVMSFDSMAENQR